MLIWNPWKEIKRLEAANEAWRKDYAELHLRHMHLGDALHAVTAEEKPTSNATVKRMARIAREALKK